MANMNEDYFKGASIVKIAVLILFFFSAMILIGQVRAKDNPPRTPGGFPKILDDEWPSQILYDTIGGCYQGTIRWVLISNPSLMGQAPGPLAQRQMVEHCFCVMDKIRKELKYKEYTKKVIDMNWTGNLFMSKAAECVGEYQTLPSFFTKNPTIDNETKTDNKTIIKPDEPKDSQDEPPGQNKEESNGLPDTLFQG